METQETLKQQIQSELEKWFANRTGVTYKDEYHQYTNITIKEVKEIIQKL